MLRSMVRSRLRLCQLHQDRPLLPDLDKDPLYLEAQMLLHAFVNFLPSNRFAVPPSTCQVGLEEFSVLFVLLTVPMWRSGSDSVRR